ncbi:MAG TPA: hypothetical protein VFB34_13875 [Chloroflexota bacterium]|nr:hypothetical protein [Chloroflexota bacterium]
MVSQEYHDFLIVSSQASAALIGLLFIAISLAPDRVFGSDASPVQRAQALSAFTALANAFFTSLAGLIPEVNMGIVAIASSLIALSQTAALLFLWRSWKEQGHAARGIFLFLVSTAVYGAELYAGVRYLGKVTDVVSLSVLFGCVLAMFFIGLSRAWELMGAGEHPGLVGELRKRIRKSPERGSAHERPGAHPRQ